MEGQVGGTSSSSFSSSSSSSDNGNVVNNRSKKSSSPSKFPLSFGEILVACGVVLGFVFGLLGVYLTMPASDYSFLKLPRTLQDLQILRYLKPFRNKLLYHFYGCIFVDSFYYLSPNY